MDVEKPVIDGPVEMQWGSDYLAEVIRRLDLPFLAINPGASLRGLHDSLVNYLGNENPQMLLCLHEDHAVSIAHGYAKVTGKPMGAVVHSNVGLMHASMGIFNAWCDRAPMIVIGATGPVDAAERRPWIDWIHTSRDQGGLVRDFTKWDDQPGSLAAAAEAMIRGSLIANTAPRGPVYLCFDVSLQEARLDPSIKLPEPGRFAPPAPPYPDPASVRRLADALAQARSPVLLAGRVSRSEESWQRRIELAERLGARVLTDLKQPAAFPTDHPLHPVAPAFFMGDEGGALLRDADLVLSLDWLDLGGTLKVASQAGPLEARVVHCSPDQYSHKGWSMDYQALPPLDQHLLCEPDMLVDALLALDAKEQCFDGRARPPAAAPERPPSPPPAGDAEITLHTLSHALRRATEGMGVSLLRTPLGWPGNAWHFRHPLDFLGKDGGAGLGSGPGMSVGAALALRGTGRLPLAVIGDGDYMMGVSAIWTAARYRIPLLFVVANNTAYFNDELHQEKVARTRSRPTENKAIGQHIGDPDIDIAGIARCQGAVGYGPVSTVAELAQALERGIADVRSGRVCVIDARVVPGYDSLMAKGLLREVKEGRH
ncbi:MAG: thiamine pyrophosphate-binding protein [Pigmentiphaga sp.]|uniref:thiamine pyrophosphate-binding protein n=1 Tax=Pigmentiphaga sp. TaxID=1977564 RepID=UPI0029AAA269|nr:thiamine pyrophosphate-binding protein [Pigmentiphaga sp.]MDX3907625.1 thiamine pyrophosphate-binding protein [Pigmentiphaga sp.]